MRAPLPASPAGAPTWRVLAGCVMLGARPRSWPYIKQEALWPLEAITCCCTLNVFDSRRLCMSLGSQNEVCDVVTLSRMETEALRPVVEGADGPPVLKSSILHK